MKCHGDPLRGTPCSEKATKLRMLPWRFGRLRGSKLFCGCPYHWQLMNLK
jgi:hypothetical protein